MTLYGVLANNFVVFKKVRDARRDASKKGPRRALTKSSWGLPEKSTPWSRLQTGQG